MTFAAPVESLNNVSTALREAEAQMPKHLKDLAIQAADTIDDLQKRCDDLIDSQKLVKGWLADWAARLELTTNVKIGQMDSASRASEKTAEAQRAVELVIGEMRGLL